MSEKKWWERASKAGSIVNTEFHGDPLFAGLFLLVQPAIPLERRRELLKEMVENAGSKKSAGTA